MQEASGDRRAPTLDIMELGIKEYKNLPNGYFLLLNKITKIRQTVLALSQNKKYAKPSLTIELSG